MNAVAAIDSRAVAPSAGSASALPAYCYLLVFGAVCIPAGVLWDISWHSTIGRDTFWTPAHIVTYLGGLIPGLTCGWLALKTHFFGTPEERAASVNLWGFRAPLGAWVSIWGCFTMLLSAPFDNWWHNAYGLDVKILSPPHTVLAIGMLGVALGVLLLMVSWQNRIAEQNPMAAYLFVFMTGILLLMASIFHTERSVPNLQHTGKFLLTSVLPYPMYLIAASRASKVRWGATITAGVYTILLMLAIWTLPLFEGSPKLAPIYNRVDHMVPPAFPLLLICPAIALDLLVNNFGGKGWFRDTLLAIALGIAFVAVYLPVQWNFSEFLISKRSDTWFFAGGHFFPYTSRADGPWRHRFWEVENDPVTTSTVLWAMLRATIVARIALAFGSWMSKVRR